VTRRAPRLALAGALTLLATATAALAAGDSPPAGRTPLPAIERATPGTRCVADTAFMRRHHMDLLKHQRGETVHQGVREARDSLRGCIGCHASLTTRSVAQAPTDFCVQCHSYAAVQIDCFECHSGKAAPTVVGEPTVRP
jgi:hypothetical protein